MTIIIAFQWWWPPKIIVAPFFNFDCSVKLRDCSMVWIFFVLFSRDCNNGCPRHWLFPDVVWTVLRAHNPIINKWCRHSSLYLHVRQSSNGSPGSDCPCRGTLPYWNKRQSGTHGTIPHLSRFGDSPPGPRLHGIMMRWSIQAQYPSPLCRGVVLEQFTSSTTTIFAE